MRFDALTNLAWISTCRVTTHKEAAAEAIRSTVTYLTAVHHTGSYVCHAQPRNTANSSKPGSDRHDTARYKGELERRKPAQDG